MQAKLLPASQRKDKSQLRKEKNGKYSLSGFAPVIFSHSLQILSRMPNPTDQAEQLPVHLQNVVFGACNVPTDNNYKNLCQYKYNIHLTFVNIGWHFPHNMALGFIATSPYLPRLRLGKYINSVAMYASDHFLLGNYQPIFTRAGWILYAHRYIYMYI